MQIRRGCPLPQRKRVRYRQQPNPSPNVNRWPSRRNKRGNAKDEHLSDSLRDSSRIRSGGMHRPGRVALAPGSEWPSAQLAMADPGLSVAQVPRPHSCAAEVRFHILTTEDKRRRAAQAARKAGMPLLASHARKLPAKWEWGDRRMTNNALGAVAFAAALALSNQAIARMPRSLQRGWWRM